MFDAEFHFGFFFLSTLDHSGPATLVATHARPTNYMFFQFYERRNLAEKLHVEEWSPSVEEALAISIQLGDSSETVLRVETESLFVGWGGACFI